MLLKMHVDHDFPINL